MKTEIKILTLSYLTALSFMIITALFDGVLSTIIYYLGFAVAVLVGLFLYSTEKGVKLISGDFLKINKRGLIATALLSAPTITVIIGISYLTTLLILITTGVARETNLDGRMWVDLILHALLPAIFEEALFRYLPLRILKGSSGLCAVAVSAVFFACVHTSFFSIPYALVAGAIFMLVDILADSVIPSLVLHFLNNTLSIIWIYFESDATFVNYYLISIISLALLSCVVIGLFCRGEIKRLITLLREGEKYSPSYEPLLFILPTLILALSEFI